MKKIRWALYTTLLLVCALCIFTVSNRAQAEELLNDQTTQDAVVALIGEKGYPSLKSAVESVESSGEATITLVADTTETATISIPAGKTITITDDGKPHTVTNKAALFNVEGTLTLNGSTNENLIFDNSSFDVPENVGGIATIKNKGHFILKHATLQGGSTTAGSSLINVGDNGGIFQMDGGIIKDFTPRQTMGSAAISVGEGATFTFNDGVIENIKRPQDEHDFSTAGAIMVFALSKNAVFTMNGGTIQNCSSGCGSAVYIAGDCAQATINGGTITQNTTGSKTNNSDLNGAVAAVNGASLVMNGGAITKNTSCGLGGGIAITSSSNNEKKVYFEMNGGTISENTALHGGGIYFAQSQKMEDNAYSAILRAGVIENNKAHNKDGIGGGIATNVHADRIRYENALITDNTASVMGGGLWNCPNGTTNTFITEGMAIFDNKAGQAGDDFVSVYADTSDPKYNESQKRRWSKMGTLFFSSRMLGGGYNNFFADGAVGGPEPKTGATYGERVLGTVLAQTPRYDAANPGTPITIQGAQTQSTSYSLKNVVSKGTKASAAQTAKLIIRGNQAAYGGGISDNGSLIGGHDNPYTIKLQKVWQNDNEATRPEKIVLKLYIKDAYIQDVELNAKNNWSAEIADFPNPLTLTDAAGNLLPIVFREGESLETQGYTFTQSEAVVDEQSATYTVTLTNSYTPPTPPEEPPVPEEPNTPPESTVPDKPKTPKKSKLPATGDASPAGILVASFSSMLLCGAAKLADKKLHK